MLKIEAYRKITLVSLCLAFTQGMWGCAATQVALEKKDLDVQTKMSETIFLDPVGPDKKTVFIDIKNTSDKEVDIVSDLTAVIAGKGYRVVQDPKLAHYLLQANILSVAKADPSALQSVIGAGYGGAVFGGTVGAGIGAATGKSWGSTAVGGIIGGIVETVSGALVKDVMYAMITDVQISERSAAPVSQVMRSDLTQGTQTTIQQDVAETVNWKRFRTRIGTSANKVNLKFEEALPEIQKGLCRSISGLF
jgi:uncharacterized protein YcfJ